MKFDVFGRTVEVIRDKHGWQAFYPGGDGKKRKARDINIPPELPEPELPDYLADLLHEYASSDKNEVKKL